METKYIELSAPEFHPDSYYIQGYWMLDMGAQDIFSDEAIKLGFPIYRFVHDYGHTNLYTAKWLADLWCSLYSTTYSLPEARAAIGALYQNEEKRYKWAFISTLKNFPWFNFHEELLKDLKDIGHEILV